LQPGNERREEYEWIAGEAPEKIREFENMKD